MKPYKVDGQGEGAAVNLSRSPDLIPSTFACGGSLKDVVHRRKPLKLDKLRKEIET
jgi:hypothetical protein